MVKTYFLILLVPVLMLACEKDSDISIVGKWKLDSIQVQSSMNGQQIFVTMYRPAQDYYDYRSDGKLYRFYSTHFDTIPYEVVSLNGSLYIKYSGIVKDSVKHLKQHSMIAMNALGGASKLYFTR